jgi:two-component system, chemotaxis family, chemotaxis protein CheY
MNKMNKTILVVDDSQSLRNLVKLILENEGFRILLAENGKEALEKMTSNEIQLLVTDLHMPVMDGMELVRNVRKSEAYRYIPILILTTETNSQIKIKAKELGATGWITKPFDNEKLIKVIKRVLR